MASLTARLFQSVMAAAFGGRLARANEADLRKALATGRRPGSGDPPANLFK